MPRTIALIRVAWRVLDQDRRLILLPVIGALVGAAFFGLMLLALSASDFFSRVDIKPGGITVYRLIAQSHVSGVTLLDFVIVVSAYLAIFGSISFFNAVLFVAARDLLEGRRRRLRRAFFQVAEKLPELVGWSCFALTVGIGIESLRSSENALLKIPGILLGMVWGFTTYFVVPLLVIEGLSPAAAVRRSTSLVKQTWGTRLIAEFGFSLVFFGLLLLIMLPLLLCVLGAPLVLVLGALQLCLPLFVVGFILTNAMNQVFQVAIFVYATTGVIPPAFPGHMVKGAYRRRGDKGRLDRYLYDGPPPSTDGRDGAAAARAWEDRSRLVDRHHLG